MNVILQFILPLRFAFVNANVSKSHLVCNREADYQVWTRTESRKAEAKHEVCLFYVFLEEMLV